MFKQIEGSNAIAQSVALCRPNVICAYPITPQTHIVESLGEIVRNGDLQNCDFINVESEMAALSVAIGSSAVGMRSYTATSSQGLLFMMEAVYNASGLQFPIVMTLGNRAIGSPINIWNDHSDAMSVRDAGWIMLFAQTTQEGVDLHIQAFAIAEQLKIPVMVCVDGFILTHAYERVFIPKQEDVDAFLPKLVPDQFLDVQNPCAIGAMVPPSDFTEVRYLAHEKYCSALGVIEEQSSKFGKIFSKKTYGLFEEYKCDDADVIVVCMGSVAGTLKDTVDSLRGEKNIKIGVVVLCSYRPFPYEKLGKALSKSKSVIVLEKAFALGCGGILSIDIELCLRNTETTLRTVIAGLGGREIMIKSLREEFLRTNAQRVTFLDLKQDIVDQYCKKLSA